MDSPKQSFEPTPQQRIENAITQRNPAWFTGKHVSAWDRVKEAFRRDWEQTKADFSKGSGQDLKQNAGDTISQAVGSARVPAMNEKTHLATHKDAVKAEEKMLDQSKKTADEMAKAQDDIDRERAKLADNTRAVTETLATKQAKAHEDMVKQQAKADEDMAKQRAQLAEDMAKQRAKLDRELAKEKATANEKIFNAAQKADANIDKAHEKMDDAMIKSDETTEAWAQAEREASYGFSARTQYPQFTEWTPALESTLRGEWMDMDTGRSWEEALPGVRRGWDFAKPQTH